MLMVIIMTMVVTVTVMGKLQILDILAVKCLSGPDILVHTKMS